MASFGISALQGLVNRISPTTSRVKLGDCLYDLINAHNDLRAKHQALLAKLDAANVAGISNNNVATAGATLPAVLLPEQR